jgi:hypothetical protein
LVADEEEDESEAPEDERLVSRLSVNVSLDEIERRYGVGTRIYFHFVRFIIVTNLLLGALTSISWFDYMRSRNCPDEGCGRISPTGQSNLGAIQLMYCFDSGANDLIIPDTKDEANPLCFGWDVPPLFQDVRRPYNASKCASTGIPALLNYTKVTTARTNPFTDDGFKIIELFTGQFSGRSRIIWQLTVSSAVVLTFFFGILFRTWVRQMMVTNQFVTKNKHSKDHDNPFAFSGLHAAMIPGHEHVTATERALRIVGSYAVFVLLLLASGGIIYALELKNRDDLADPSVVVYGIRPLELAVTSVVTLINVLFNSISGYLTFFERHQLWQDQRRHNTMKLFMFKILNVMAMNFAIGGVAISSSCIYSELGRKYLLLIITDLVLGNAIELFVPWFQRVILAPMIPALQSKTSDEAMKPEFDVSQEYLELFYRQFVIYVGQPLFPLLPWVGAVSNIIEYGLDKYKLTKVCQKPKRLDITMKSFLGILLTITSVFAIAMPPTGNAWVLAGSMLGQSEPLICPLYDTFNYDEQPIAADCNVILESACRDAVAAGADLGFDCNVFNPILAAEEEIGGIEVEMMGEGEGADEL